MLHSPNPEANLLALKSRALVHLDLRGNGLRNVKALKWIISSENAVLWNIRAPFCVHCAPKLAVAQSGGIVLLPGMGQIHRK